MQKEGTITGVLPYSRMTEASGFGVCLRSTEIIKLHKSYFNEMINHHHSLTTALVHFMTSRVRSFTSLQKQNEKLMSLQLNDEFVDRVSTLLEMKKIQEL